MTGEEGKKRASPGGRRVFFQIHTQACFLSLWEQSASSHPFQSDPEVPVLPLIHCGWRNLPPDKYRVSTFNCLILLQQLVSLPRSRLLSLSHTVTHNSLMNQGLRNLYCATVPNQKPGCVCGGRQNKGWESFATPCWVRGDTWPLSYWSCCKEAASFVTWSLCISPPWGMWCPRLPCKKLDLSFLATVVLLLELL